MIKNSIIIPDKGTVVKKKEISFSIYPGNISYFRFVNVVLSIAYKELLSGLDIFNYTKSFFKNYVLSNTISEKDFFHKVSKEKFYFIFGKDPINFVTSLEVEGNNIFFDLNPQIKERLIVYYNDDYYSVNLNVMRSLTIYDSLKLYEEISKRRVLCSTWIIEEDVLHSIISVLSMSYIKQVIKDINNADKTLNLFAKKKNGVIVFTWDYPKYFSTLNFRTCAKGGIW